MNVDRIDVRLAARPAYEAQDLGLQLLRRNARQTFGAVAAVALPIWAALLLLDLPSPGISLLVIWWLKPVLDRVALHVLSRAVFGQVPRVSETLAALPGLFDRPLIECLTWRRFQLRRSLWMPIACLEGLRGKDLRQRRSALEYGEAQGAATVATIVFLHLEGGLALSMFLLTASFLPDDLLPPFLDMIMDESFESTRAYDWLSAATWLPCLLLVEVLYVAAGFGLYLSRRTQLEGWDIDLAFGRLGARLREAARRGIAVGLALACACFGLADEAWASPAPVQSEEQSADPRDVALEVLEHEDFDTEITVPKLRYSFDGDGGGFGFGPLLGQALTVLAWGLLIAIVVALVVYLARRIERPVAALSAKRAPPPAAAFGLDLRPESLPADIAGAASELASRGEFVAALSLLYRGALARLVEHDQLEIAPGDTEHDCIARVRAASEEPDGPRPTYFSRLTDSWLRAAWGASPPSSESTLALCEGWARHFEVPRR